MREPMLQLSKLSKRYKTGDLAVDAVDLKLAKGEVIALIGASGAGKSTLIRCINRLVEPTSGSITVGGTEINALPPAKLRLQRRKIGMIFQEYALVERLSVMENALSGRLGYTGFWASTLRRYPISDVRRAIELLARVGLSDQLDKRADALSGGQRQRVGIVRALMQAPDLLLVDEPTASLDPKTGREVMRLIVELAKENDVAGIVNIHDVDLAKRFVPRIVGLRAGRVVFDGPPSELDAEQLTVIYGDEDWSSSVETA